MIQWCRNNLTPIDPNFQFIHQDIFSPGYSPGNSLRLPEPFPVNDSEVSLVIALSVFTHLTKGQVEYYLSEVARILSPQGIAWTTWFFFDRASFPFLPEVYCLYTSVEDFAQAVLFDREWFLTTVRNLGLGVRMTLTPPVAGHQWTVLLARRTPDMVDEFPLGEEAAEWVSGASKKPMAAPIWPAEKLPKMSAPRVGPYKPEPPPLFGALAELDRIKRTWFWKMGRLVKRPSRILRRS